MNKINKALFVNPHPRVAKTIMEASQLPPLGLAYTAAYLEQKGIECEIIDANLLKIDEKQVLQKIQRSNPDLIGISFNIATLTEAINISKEAKKIGKYSILGGPLPFEDLKKVLELSEADCIVRGEGEIITWQIVEAINKEKPLYTVKGIALLKNKELIKTPEEEKIENLDSLPFPAYHLLPDLKLYKNRSRKFPIAPLITQRGCPYGCMFCGSQRTGFRARSPKNVLEEIEYLIKKFGVKQIDILDDNFTFDLKRAEKILDMIIEKNLNIAITFPNGLRADRLTEEIVKKMKKAGVYRTGIGIESGNQKIIDGINKNLDLNQVKKAIKWLRQNNITVFGYFQFGLPGETKETMAQTIKYAKEANPHWANFGITTPLPGTELYAKLKREGQIKETTPRSIGEGFYSIKKSHYTLKSLTKQEIEQYQKKAWKEFYFRPYKIIDVLRTIRSYREFLWTFQTAIPILKGLFVKKTHQT